LLSPAVTGKDGESSLWKEDGFLLAIPRSIDIWSNLQKRVGAGSSSQMPKKSNNEAHHRLRTFINHNRNTDDPHHNGTSEHQLRISLREKLITGWLPYYSARRHHALVRKLPTGGRSPVAGKPAVCDASRYGPAENQANRILSYLFTNKDLMKEVMSILVFH